MNQYPYGPSFGPSSPQQPQAQSDVPEQYVQTAFPAVHNVEQPVSPAPAAAYYGEQPVPLAYAPNFQAGCPPRQNVPPAYAFCGQAYPVVPPYGIRGSRIGRDPRIWAASGAMNRMCLLALAQTGASFLWGILVQILSMLTGIAFFTEPMGYWWLSGALVPLSTVLPFFLYFKISRASAADYLRFEKVGFTGGLLCVLAGLGVTLMGNRPAVFAQMILSLFGYEPNETPFGGVTSAPSLILELLVIAVLVPVMEEFVFRGVLLSTLRKFGLGFSVVGSALIFALAHMELPNVLFAFVAGMVLGALYAFTNNLWITIAIHALNNGLSVFTSHCNFLFGEQTGETVSAVLMIGAMLVGLAALALLLILKRDIFITRRSPRYNGPANPMNGEESALSIVRAPAFWALVLLMVLYTVQACVL